MMSKKIDNVKSFINDQIISSGVDFGTLKSVTGIFVNPKIKMAQIGGDDIIGERISTEPIMDRFGNFVYIHSSGRIIKSSFLGEINLEQSEIEWLKKFNDEI